MTQRACGLLKSQVLTSAGAFAFKEDGSLDEIGIDAFGDFYRAAGVPGFFALGTHGQGMVMEIDEKVILTQPYS